VGRSKLGDIDVVLEDGKTINLDLDDIIPIGGDLNVEFREQPSLYAYIAMLAADAESMWREAKRTVDEVYAETDKAVRDELQAYDKRITEKKVASEVEIRRGYREAVAYELACRHQYNIMNVLQESMDMRSHMLISLGAHERAEAEQTGMSISEKTKERLNELRKNR